MTLSRRPALGRCSLRRPPTVGRGGNGGDRRGVGSTTATAASANGSRAMRSSSWRLVALAWRLRHHAFDHAPRPGGKSGGAPGATGRGVRCGPLFFAPECLSDRGAGRSAGGRACSPDCRCRCGCRPAERRRPVRGPCNPRCLGRALRGHAGLRAGLARQASQTEVENLDHAAASA